MWEICPHLSSLRDPQFAYGFPQTEVDLGFFFQDGEPAVSPGCFTENPMLKPLFSGIPYSSDSGTFISVTQIPRDLTHCPSDSQRPQSTSRHSPSTIFFPNPLPSWCHHNPSAHR